MEKDTERGKDREKDRESLSFLVENTLIFFFCFFDMLNTGNPLCSVISHAGALTCHALFY